MPVVFLAICSQMPDGVEVPLAVSQASRADSEGKGIVWGVVAPGAGDDAGDDAVDVRLGLGFALSVGFAGDAVAAGGFEAVVDGEGRAAAVWASSCALELILLLRLAVPSAVLGCRALAMMEVVNGVVADETCTGEDDQVNLQDCEARRSDALVMVRYVCMRFWCRSCRKCNWICVDTVQKRGRCEAARI